MATSCVQSALGRILYDCCVNPGTYESRSKLQFTSFSLGGSRYAKIPRSIGDVLKLQA